MHAIQDWEVIIVGAGPAGSAAAMVLARSRRKVLLIDEGKPRNIRSHGIHNYLTRDGILPAEFLELRMAELKKYGVAFIKERVEKATTMPDSKFELTDSKGNKYHALKLLIATGVTDNIPDIPGMHELWGNGVYHCPYCDGWELHGQTVGLYARRYNGYGMALALSRLAAKVVLFTDTARYLKVVQRRHLLGMDIEICSTKVEHLTCSEGKLTCVTLADGSSIGCDSMFTHHGVRYNNDLILQLGGRCNALGATVTSKRQECSIPGVYVAGDTSFDMQFVTVAAGEGLKAAVAINNSLLTAENTAMARNYS